MNTPRSDGDDNGEQDDNGEGDGNCLVSTKASKIEEEEDFNFETLIFESSSRGFGLRETKGVSGGGGGDGDGGGPEKRRRSETAEYGGVRMEKRRGEGVRDDAGRRVRV
ncbi:hypothetical protein Droror1_Dr00015104 [Drosera rotundifolia]